MQAEAMIRHMIEGMPVASSDRTEDSRPARSVHSTSSPTRR